MKKVAVVGAGIGGLSAAIELALAGFEVEVFEQQSGPGGKAFERRIGRYRFDTGPSLLTMAHLWEELFAKAGKRLSDYLTLKQLDPICHYFFPDGDTFQSPGSVDAMVRALSEKGWASEKELVRFFQYCRKLWSIAGDLFLRKSLHDVRTYASWKTLKSFLRMGSIDFGRSMKTSLTSFFSHPKTVQIFSRYATYNGSDPSRVPATLNMIVHVEYALGSWDVQGGIYALPLAMERLAREVGVRFHYGQRVEAIEHDQKRVQGVRVDGKTEAFDTVVSNADVLATYALLEKSNTLLPAQSKWQKRYRNFESSSSGIVFLWGIRHDFSSLGLHNIFFTTDYDSEFRSIFQSEEPGLDPTVYVNITSKTNPNDAPQGCENWFVLVNTPKDTGQDWNSIVPRVRAAVLQKVSTTLGKNVEDLIETEAITTPRDLSEKTSSWAGSLYGLASNHPLAAFFRHPNRAPGTKGLYLCSGSAHPGGGMPLALLSGRIASELLIREVQP